MSIVHKIESYLPKKFVEDWRFLKKYIAKQHQYKRVIKRLKKKESPIRVFFFALDPSTWKYESVYRLMEKDDKFDPIVLVCPIDNQGEEYKHNKLEECYKYFSENNYNVISTYDKEHDTYLDAHELKPDIIFYTNPYRYLIDDRYYINRFNDVLTCYVNYTYNSVPFKFSCALDFHQLIWRYYTENKDNLALVKQFYNGRNCRVTGFPMIDVFRNNQVKTWPWKLENRQLKRVIWAPHHTIEGNTDDIALSTFLLYYDTMLRIAEQYKDKIQFAFKPHPLLQRALYKHPKWGKERTDAYYNRWENGENTTYIKGAYQDLFCTSDAMIHDCASFIIEYMYINKPCLILDDGGRLSQCNVTATNAYNCHYKGTSEKDIYEFIEQVVLDGQDERSDIRQSFYNKYLLPPFGESVAQNIIDDIAQSIWNNK